MLKATDEGKSEPFQGWEAQHPAKMLQTRASPTLSVYSLSTGCVCLGTTGSGRINLSLCLAYFVKEESRLSDLIFRVFMTSLLPQQSSLSACNFR